MKKIIAMIACLSVIFGLTGCGSGELSSSNSSDSKSKEPKEISMNDIDWTVEQGINDNSIRCYLYTITNNSEYTIVDFMISFTEKGDISEEDHNAMVDELADEYEWPDEDREALREEGVTAYLDTHDIYLPAGESYNGECSALGMILTSDSVYNNTEADIATIEYIDGDRVITAHYDFKSEKMTIEADSDEAFGAFPTEGICADLPECNFEECIYELDDLESDSIDICAYNASKEDLTEYINTLQEAGFTVDDRSYLDVSCFECLNSDGLTIELSYESDDGFIEVYVTKDI